MLTLVSVWIEIKCPQHGFERFKIKIVRRFNMKSDVIMPKFRTRPTVGDLSCLLVGKNVDYMEIQKFLHDYFRRRGMAEALLKMKLIV